MALKDLFFKNFFVFCSLFFFLSSTVVAQTKNEVLAYLASLPSQNKVLVGQHCGDGNHINEWAYPEFVEALHTASGKWVGMVAGDYGWKYTTEPSVVNQSLIKHASYGGLVQLTWHCMNPWTGGGPRDNQGNHDLNELITPGSSVYDEWMSELDKMAAGLQELKDNGIVVLWRPLHEMNASWFWWGNREQEAYVNVWRHMHNYFTNTKGLDNLLWLYAVTLNEASYTRDEMLYYPGGDYVDMVGEDLYNNDPTFHTYDYLTAETGKPYALMEFGPGTDDQDYDNLKTLEAARGKACFWLQWHSWTGNWKAIIDNQNHVALMNHEDVITADEITYSLDANPPGAPTNLTVSNETANACNLSWTAPNDNDISGYRIYVDDVYIKTVTGTSASVDVLSCGTDYQITVKTQDQGTNVSPPSNTAIASTAACGGGTNVFQQYKVIITQTLTNESTTSKFAGIEIRDKSGNLHTVSGDNWGLALPGEVVQDFESDIDADSLRIKAIYDANVAPGIIELQGSNDGSNWSNLGNWEATEAQYTEAEWAAWSIGGKSISDKQAPSTPSNLSSSNITLDDVDLSWSASSDNVGVAKYNVYKNNVFLQSTTQNSISVTNLDCDKSYMFTVNAEDAQGNVSNISNIITVNTKGCDQDNEAPTAPANLTASGITKTTAYLTWDASTDNIAVTEYEVYRDGSLIQTLTSTSTTVWELSCGSVSYNFTVKAKDALGNTSNSSNTSSISTNSCTGNGLPSPWENSDIGTPGAAGSASESNGTFTVEGAGDDVWGESDQFHYVYQPLLSVNGEIIAKVNSLENVDQRSRAGVMIRSGLGESAKYAMMVVTSEDGTTFQYRMQNTTDYFAPVDSITAPYWVKLTRNNDQFIGYKSADGSNWTPLDTIAISMPENVYIGLLVNSHVTDDLCTAEFTNVQLNGEGGGNDDTEAPTAPSNVLSSNITQTRVDLSWNASTDNVGVTEYNVYKDGTLESTVTGTSASITGLSCGTSYGFTVSAKDAAGNESAASSTETITTSSCPDTEAPTVPSSLVSSNITQTRVDLSWNASTDNVEVTEYNVYKDGTLESTVTGTSASITGLSCATSYGFTVTAKDASGNESTASSTETITTSDCNTGSNTYQHFKLVITKRADGTTNDAKYKGIKVVDINGTDHVIFSGNEWGLPLPGEEIKDFAMDIEAAQLCIQAMGSWSANGAPGEFELFGSNDGSVWTSIDSWTTDASVYGDTYVCFDIENTSNNEDTETPSVPSSLVSSNITQTSVDLSWNASTDNVGVTEYNVYKDGTLESTVTGTSASITGLTCATSYGFKVTAKDASGNESTASSTETITTSDCNTGSDTYQQFKVVITKRADGTTNDAKYKGIKIVDINGNDHIIFSGNQWGLTLPGEEVKNFGYAIEADQLCIQAMGSWASNGAPGEFELFGSDDGINWNSLNSWITDASVYNDSYVCFTINNTKSSTLISESNNEQAHVNVFPNPATNMFTVLVPKSSGSINITDLHGKTMIDQNVSSSSLTFDVSDFPSGVYIVKIMNGRKQHIELLIIK